MPKQRKLADPTIRAQVEADLKVMTRAEVCKKHGVDYFMLRKEFGNAWTHAPQAPKEVVDNIN